MKKLLVAILAIGLMASPALAANGGGGKNKAKKKAKTECKKDKSCDVKNCDPKNCDPKTCHFPTCSKDQKCSSTTTVANNK